MFVLALLNGTVCSLRCSASGSSCVRTALVKSSCTTNSVCRAPAGEVENRPGRERTLLGAKPRHERSDLIDLSEASHGDLREHELHVLVAHLVEDRGAHR